MIVRGLIWYLESPGGTGTLQTIITFLICWAVGGGVGGAPLDGTRLGRKLRHQSGVLEETASVPCDALRPYRAWGEVVGELWYSWLTVRSLTPDYPLPYYKQWALRCNSESRGISAIRRRATLCIVMWPTNEPDDSMMWRVAEALTVRRNIASDDSTGLTSAFASVDNPQDSFLLTEYQAC